MKQLLVCLFLLTAPSFAQSPFDGTWIANLNTAQLSSKPNIFLLNKGMYSCSSCSTCTPAVAVKADGQDQKVGGSDYLDSVAIRVVDSRTVEETDKKGGRIVFKNTSVVSPDGKTLTSKFEEDFGAQPITGEQTYTRISPGPAGSHEISGSWRSEKLSHISTTNGIALTYKSQPNGLKMTANNGESYDAKFDGRQYPLNGDPGHTTVSIQKIGTHTLEETYTRKGRPISTFLMSVSPDGKVMTVTAHDIEQDRTNHFTLNRKS